MPAGDASVMHPMFGERAAAPLRVAGCVWGALVAAVGHGARLGEEADRQLRRFAQVIEVAVAESTAREALAALAAQQTVVAELGRRATEGAAIAELFQFACEGTREAMPADITAVMETEGDGDEIAVHAAAGTAQPLEPGHRISRRDAPITMAAVEQREPTLVEDTGDLEVSAPIVSEHGIRTVLAAPIRLREEVYGVLVATRLSDRPFTTDDRAFLQSVANVHRRRHLPRPRRGGDAPAGAARLPHRPAEPHAAARPAGERAGRGRRRARRRVAVLTCDFDGFARINEQAGHAVGDEVLRQAAARIAAALEPRDTLTRASGDEFVVIREDADGPADAGGLGKQLLDALGAPYDVGGSSLPAVSASVGIALRGRGDDPEAALRDADTAAHRAHVLGRGHLEIFDESMREGLLARLALESDLRRMVHGRELRLHYMPLVSLADRRHRRLRGAGALGAPGARPARARRVHRRGRGDRRHPGDRPLGDRARLPRRGHLPARRARRPPAADVGNLSPRQLADPGIVDHVAATLADAGLPAAQLALEITETVLLEEDPVHHERLAALRALGVAIVLDDFGTGYSSLGYLRGLALDGLKLDRSFVAGLGSDERTTTIVAAVTQLAHALGLPVTAEGVETAEQVASLQTLGCQFGQGYLFSRPVPRAAARALLVR